VSEIIHSLAPIINDDSRALILGTMPSVISLQKQEYYANPRNQFWSIIDAIYQPSQFSKPNRNYEGKIDILKQKRVGIWDVLKVCERDGSGDPDIKNGVSNNFIEMLTVYPNIKAVFFNGKKAYQLFFKLNDERSFKSIEFISLPSTSPANAGMSFKQKVESWYVVRKCTEGFNPV
jgi:hypoxanthine-DNA glycosylase